MEKLLMGCISKIVKEVEKGREPTINKQNYESSS